ncbi:MAG: nitrogen regulation protein NR(I) [Sphingomonadales bacterium]
MSRQLTVLVADDDASIRTIISEALTGEGYDVIAVESGAALWHHVEKGEGDVLITDVIMPDVDGLELVPRIRLARPELPIIVISAQNTLETAVRAAKAGAFEYLPKPFDLDELTEAVRKAYLGTKEEGGESLPVHIEKTPLVGRSPAMQALYKTLARVVGTELTIRITGESGTGKELVARAVHELGHLADGPFVAVNMAAIPSELIESELFGHEKGAFTGADKRAPGRFEEASGGTLFLDEIGDMPLEAQTRLLRVLQQGEYRPVGGQQIKQVKVRIIAATHQNLAELVKAGRFRQDLYFRINVVPVEVPPLRDRVEDIQGLVAHFLRLAQADGLERKRFAADAVDELAGHGWPGNVRELENMVRRICALYPEPVINRQQIRLELERETGKTSSSGGKAKGGGLSQAVLRHLERYFEAHEGELPPAGLYARILRDVERPLITLSLAATQGNQLRAAELLGLNRNTLRKKIRELGLKTRL